MFLYVKFMDDKYRADFQLTENGLVHNENKNVYIYNPEELVIIEINKIVWNNSNARFYVLSKNFTLKYLVKYANLLKYIPIDEDINKKYFTKEELNTLILLKEIL